MTSVWRIGAAGLAFVAAIFHLWYASRMSLSSEIGQYFAISGVLFLVGTALILLKGSGIVFKFGTVGVLALAAIDNGLLYYTRTYGLGFLGTGGFPSRPPGASSGRAPGSFNGTFTRTINGTVTTISRSVNGTLGRLPSGGPPAGGHFGPAWSTTWNPPGAVQFFVLQCAIIAVAAVALWMGSVRAHQHGQAGAAAATPSP